MAVFRNVAVVGASGNLGPHIINGLLDAGFTVTVLTRESSNSTFPSGVAVKKVNFDNSESLKSALQGQDALVSVIATMAIASQNLLFDAAIAAGVKRIIPSEFGTDTQTVTGPMKMMLAGKIAALEYLKEKTQENPSVTWTGISNSAFFDWSLDYGITGFEADTKTATIIDSGNEKVSWSNLAFVGRCVAAALKKPEDTANKYLTVAEVNASQNDMLAFIQKETGTTWTIKQEKSSDLDKSGHEALAKGDGLTAFVNFLKAGMFGDGSGNAIKPEKNATQALGVKCDTMEDTIRAWLNRKGLV